MNGTIYVVENAPEVEGKKTVGTTKTEGSIRDVPVHDRLRPILNEQLNEYCWNRFDPEALVFPAPAYRHGQRMISTSNFRARIFQPAARRAGVLNAAGVTPTVHDLRHTAATEWLRLGFSELDVAGMLGHTNPAMVRKIYGGHDRGELQRKMALLSASEA